jgi:ribosomal protein S12 methylthiotransferase
MSKPVKVALIAMGCEKNVINSEQMLWLLDRAGFELVGDPEDADVTVINTCAFTGDARDEALEQIGEVTDVGGRVIVAGCLPELRRQRPVHGLPRIEGLVGTGRFDDIVSAVQAVLKGQTPVYFGNLDAPVSETPRILTSPSHTAYIKIAEGCGNHCSYCVIPSIRGPYRRRPREAIFDEAKDLIQIGVTELILVAQDVTRYPSLPRLLNDLCKLKGLRRLRLHYLYPELVTDELIGTIAAQPKIARYLDIPMQHASDRILKAMNRRTSRAGLEELIEKLRERLPGVVLRTSIIVGFPGETKDDFEELLDFLAWARIPRSGVFTYSREPGTAAAELPLQVTEKVKKQRQRRAEVLQSRVIDAFNREREGSVARVLTEGYDSYAKLYYGRSDAESPEVDGVIFFTSDRPVSAGEWVKVLLTGAVDADGKGRRVE